MAQPSAHPPVPVALTSGLSTGGRSRASLTRFWLGLDGRRADGGSAISADLTALHVGLVDGRPLKGVLLVGSRRAPAEAPRRKHEPMRRSSSGRPSESLPAGNTSRCGLPVAVVKLPWPSASLRDSRVCVAGKLSGGRRCVPRLNRALAERLQSPLPARRRCRTSA